MSCTAAWNQKAFRGRNDDGNETTATWKANQNTNWANLKDVNLRVRFEIQETAGCAGSNKVWQLQYNKNGAGWNNVTAVSSVVRSSASPNLADAANLTDQLTAGTGTFQGATGFDEVDGKAGGASMDVVASGHAEAEFCIQIRSADVASGDTIQLRATDNGTAFAAYDATPSVTVDSGTVTLTPGVGSLDLTGFAPTKPTKLTADVGSLDLTGFAPAKPTKIILGVGSLDLTGFEPTVPTKINLGVGSLDLTGFSPTIPVTVTPGTGSLDITGFSPTVPVIVTPGTGAIDLTGFVPTKPTNLTPEVGSLDLTGFSPTKPTNVTPGIGALDLTGYEPTITVGGGGGGVTVVPGVGNLDLTGFSPTFTTSQAIEAQKAGGLYPVPAIPKKKKPPFRIIPIEEIIDEEDEFILFHL